jgi:hypothetical protein
VEGRDAETDDGGIAGGTLIAAPSERSNEMPNASSSTIVAATAMIRR